MSETECLDRWREIEEVLIGGGLDELAAWVRKEAATAHAASLHIPIIGEIGSGKSALIAHLLGGDATASFPQDVLESTAHAVSVKHAGTGYRAVVNDGTGAWEECPDDAQWNALVRGRDAIADGSRLEVGLPSPDLAHWNATLVDTPGMNTNTPDLEGRAWAAAATAPVVILAIPADAVGRRTDVDYLVSLGDNSSSVVIALTKVDHLPEGSEKRIVDDLVSRLRKRDIAPIAILPTSAEIPRDDQRSGIAKLRDVLGQITGERRARLVACHAGGRVAAHLRSERSALLLRKAALESDASTAQRRGEGEERDIAAHGVDQEEDVRVGAVMLKDRCERLRLESFNRMHDIGEEILAATSEEIERLPTQHDVQRFADGAVPRSVLQWRERSIAAAEERLAALDREVVEAARGVAAQHLEQMKVPTEWLQEVPVEAVLSRADHDAAALKDLQRSREELLRQMQELRERAPGGEELEQMERTLARSRDERDALVYEPQMDAVRLDRGKRQLQDAGKTLGTLADVALTLAPIPVGKLGALKGLPGGAKIMEGIQKYNSLIGARDRWLHALLPIGRTQHPAARGTGAARMTPHGWLTAVLDNLSLATWGERLMGAVGDWLSPDAEVRVENQQVRQEFEQRKQPHDDRVVALESEQARFRLRQEHVTRQLGERQTALERIDRRQALLQQSATDAAIGRQESDAEQAKSALMATLRRQLLGHAGDTCCADLRRAVGAGFDVAREELERRLREQVVAIQSEVDRALQAARSKRAEGEAAVKETLRSIGSMIAAAQSALAQVEAL